MIGTRYQLSARLNRIEALQHIVTRRVVDKRVMRITVPKVPLAYRHASKPHIAGRVVQFVRRILPGSRRGGVEIVSDVVVGNVVRYVGALIDIRRVVRSRITVVALWREDYRQRYRKVVVHTFAVGRRRIVHNLIGRDRSPDHRVPIVAEVNRRRTPRLIPSARTPCPTVGAMHPRSVVVGSPTPRLVGYPCPAKRLYPYPLTI